MLFRSVDVCGRGVVVVVEGEGFVVAGLPVATAVIGGSVVAASPAQPASTSTSAANIAARITGAFPGPASPHRPTPVSLYQRASFELKIEKP